MLASITTIGLTGCKEEVPFSSVESKMADAISSVQISGHAVDGLIASGDVSVYDFKDGRKGAVMGTGITDELGAFTTTIEGVSTTESQFVMACVESGSYTEEASGTEIILQEGDELCAIKLFQPDSDFSVVINPWSHYAVASALYKIDQGEDVISAVDAANTAISTVYGFNILDTVPRDLTDIVHSGQPYDDAMKMATSIAGISQFVLGAANGVGVSQHSDDFSSIKLHAIIFNDIAADGILDGIGLSNDGNSTISLGMGNVLFDRETYSKDFAISNLEFVRSNKNVTDITDVEILSEQARIASSTSAIFPVIPEGQPVPSLDSEAPVVTFNLTANAFLSGNIDLTGTVTDFSGVQTLVLNVGGTEIDLNPGNTFSTSFSTLAMTDGPLNISLAATDLLNNTSTTDVNVIVANAQPLSNITSDLIVGSASYDFTANLTDYDQGVASITVNGVTAALDQFGEITASLTLLEGSNTLTMVLIDDLGQSFDYTYTVGVDLSAPSITSAIDASPYTVFYKEIGTGEPVSSNLVFNTSDLLYVTEFNKTLSGTGVSSANLRTVNWPMLEVSISDLGVVASSTADLVVNYSYRQNGTEITNRTISPVSGNNYIVPFATEFLTAGWEAFEGTQLIEITATDEMGNIRSKNYTFESYAAIPNLVTSIDVDTYLSGETALIDFSSQDFTGMDEIVFTVNGVEYRTTDVTNPSFNIDTTGLPGGANSVDIKAYKDGVVAYTDTIVFSIDGTPAVINVTSAQMTNQNTYSLTGEVTDPESGVGMILVNEQTPSSISNGNFSDSLSGLLDGLNEFVIKAYNGAGALTQETAQLYVDTEAPGMTFSNVATLVNPTTETLSGTCFEVSKNGYESGLASVSISGVNTTCTGGTWSANLSTWVHGVNNINGIVTDLAGNNTQVNKVVNVVLDTAPPEPVAVYFSKSVAVDSGSTVITKTINFTDISSITSMSLISKVYTFGGSSYAMPYGGSAFNCNTASTTSTSITVSCNLTSTSSVLIGNPGASLVIRATDSNGYSKDSTIVFEIVPL
jgi:hypothetical protein